MSSAAWATTAERGSVLGMRLTAWIYRRCGWRLAAALVAAVVAYFFVTDGRGRRASRRYLERVYATAEGARALGRPPGLGASLRHYLAFGLATLDRARFALDADPGIDLAVHGGEHLQALIGRRQGAVLVGAHLGSFDALRALAARHRIKVNVVMSTGHATRINSVLERLNPDTRVNVLDLAHATTSVHALRASIARGEFVAILGDRVGRGARARAVAASFLGARARFPRGPFVLAATLRCPLVLLLALRAGHRRYDVYAEPLADAAREAPADRRAWLRETVALYAARLEAHCRRAPWQWFNFYDFWDEDARVPAPARP